MNYLHNMTYLEIMRAIELALANCDYNKMKCLKNSGNTWFDDALDELEEIMNIKFERWRWEN